MRPWRAITLPFIESGRAVTVTLRIALMLFSLTVSASLLVGCSLVAVLKGEPGKNLSALAPGMSKRDADAQLGAPIREWLTPQGIRYGVYRYDAGVPRSYSGAVGVAFFELCSGVVIYEGIEALASLTDGRSLTKAIMEQERIYRQVAISFNDRGQILGVFDNFNELDWLPDNGVREIK